MGKEVEMSTPPLMTVKWYKSQQGFSEVLYTRSTLKEGAYEGLILLYSCQGRIQFAQAKSTGERIHRQRMLNEDGETPHFQYETDFKHKWVANYGLKKLKMEISRYMGPSCAHQKSVQGLASAKHCAILPSIEINGIVRHIQWTPREIEVYITCLEKVMKRYVQRLQWLLSGSRRLFGTILERKVCILVDTSGSMGPYLQQVKTELVLLIWEQLRKHCDSFNLLSFAEDLQLWRDTLVDTTDEACHEAMQWVTHLRAHGSTSVLQALLKAFTFHDVEGLYLLTDGKPNTSCSLILHEVQKLTETRDVKMHTIALNHSGRAAGDFLRNLAALTGGRYHCPVDEDTLLRIHGLLTKGIMDERDSTLPLFEGDDLRRLAQEITKARSFLWKAQSFRSQLQKKNNTEPNVTLF